MYFPALLPHRWRFGQAWLSANTGQAEPFAQASVIERQALDIFQTTFEQPVFRLGGRHRMRSPLEMHEHPQGGAAGETCNNETAGL